MTAVVIRSKKAGGFLLSDEARERARKQLEAAGIPLEHTQPIVWPDDAISATQTHRGAPWVFTTRGDILRRKRNRMERNLFMKREYGVVKRVPLYVWVFHCPGLGGKMVGALGHPGIRSVGTTGLMGGWYTYLIGQGVSVALNFRGYNQKMLDRVMELFPLVKATTLFDGPDVEEWMLAFVEQYPKGLWCDIPQGKAPVWAEVQEDSIKRLLSVAEWPSDRKD